MNKKWYGIIALIIVGTLILSSMALIFTNQSFKQEWKWYESKEWGFRIKYPTDWEVKTEEISFFVDDTESKSYNTIFFPPKNQNVTLIVYRTSVWKREGTEFEEIEPGVWIIKEDSTLSSSITINSQKDADNFSEITRIYEKKRSENERENHLF
jgi:hypothetical protein